MTRGLTTALVALAGLCVTGCASGLYSSQPLFTQAKEQIKPGLWALMAPDCTTVPTSASIPDWPNCAMPVWIQKQRLTFVMPPVNHFNLVLSDGDPKILQLEMREATSYDKTKGLNYIYWSFRPQGAAPFVRGIVRPIRCPEAAKPIAGIDAQTSNAVADMGTCTTAKAGAVRQAAQVPPSDKEKDKDGRAIWIADLPSDSGAVGSP
jgi:hypothetical protein